MPLSAPFTGIGLAPRLLSATAPTSLTVVLTFNEEMLANAALALGANYTLTPAAGSTARTVTSAVKTAATQVTLGLSGALTTGTSNYTLLVVNIADLAGNVIDAAFDTATISGPAQDHPHTTPSIVSHCEAAKARLAAQFRDKTKLEAIVCAVADQVQAIEQAEADLLAYRGISTAIGAQLDLIGQSMVLVRNGMSDDAYRLRLRTWGKVIASRGSADELLQIADLLDNGFTPVISYTEPRPASAIIGFTVPAGSQLLGEEVGRFLKAAKAGGVHLIAQYYETTINIFTFREIGVADAPTLGFNELATPGVGGTFAEAV